MLYPRIMKRSVDVSPAVTIVAVLVGASLMGIVGALLAIPIAAAIQLIMVEVVIPRQDTALAAASAPPSTTRRLPGHVATRRRSPGTPSGPTIS